MCFSKDISITTFVLGIIANLSVGAYIFKAGYSHLPYRYAILCLWSYALLMQLPEAVAWNNIDRQQPSHPSVEKAAYWLNNLQPLAAVVAVAGAYFVVNKTWPTPTIIIAIAAAGIFTYKAIEKSGDLLGRDVGIAPDTGCSHLNLHWWKDDGLLPYLGLYILAMFAAILILPSNSMKFTQSAVYFGTLLLSTLLYKCGQGSLWCWMVAAAGLTVLIP
jgi:hypothetical protein